MSRDTGKAAGSQRRPVSGDTMVEIALALVDALGLEALTMRRLAEAAGVQAPALYRRFANKQDLLDAMAEVIIAEALADPALAAGGDWAQRLAELARSLRRALLAHRDSARVVGGNYAAKRNTLTFADAAIGALVEAGFTPGAAAWGTATVTSYTIGEVLEQQAVPRGDLDAGRLTAQLRAGLRDHAGAHVHPDLPWEQFLDFDSRYEFGLRTIISGLDRERPIAR